MKRVLSYVLIFILVIPLFTFGLIYGTDERSMLDTVRGNISTVQDDLAAGRRQAQQLTNQLRELEGRLNAVQAEINALAGDITTMEARIDVAQGELDALQEDIYEQNEQLNARLRAMYINGNISVLEVLFSSGSIVDFMTNMDRVRLIHESDVAVIEALEEQHRLVNTFREYLDGLRAELVRQREEEQRRQAALRQSQREVDDARAEVVLSNEALTEMLDALNEEANRLTQIIISQMSGADFIGGEFIWPVRGRVSSEFGYRVHPVLRTRRMHTGIDIAAPTGTPILAANSGTVIVQGWNNSYGNMIIIDHGGGIATLYAHNSVNSVNVGDIVVQGQEIGRVGSTGMSTGPHLHFEVRVDGQFRNPREFLQ
jgi:murein DD-endopeptidase MepM/ murein hydrolase activator NlpD